MDLALPLSAAVLASYVAYPGSIHSLDRLPEPLALAAAVLGGYCAITSSYVFNDYVDVDVDAINLPGRPLPTGKVSRWGALAFGLLLAGMAVAVAVALNPQSLVVLLAAVLTITTYSAAAKRRTWLSFLPVGVAYGLVPVGVWLAFDPAGPDGVLPVPAVLFGLMICVTDWGFTLSGVSRDVGGDRLRDVPTFPVTFGIPATARLVTACWATGVGLSIAIWATAGLGWPYLAAAVGGGAWLLYQCADFLRHPAPARGGRLFLQAGHYRGVLFAALVADVVLTVALGPTGA